MKKHVPLYATDDVRGPKYEYERDEVAEQQPSQQNVGELTAGSLDYRSVVVVGEHPRHEQRDQTAGEGEAHGTDGPGALGP